MHEDIKVGDTLAEVLDAASEAYLFADNEGSVMLATSRFKEYFGITPGELGGRSVTANAERLSRCFSEPMTYHEVFSFPVHDHEHEFIRDVEIASPKHRFLQISSAPVKHGETFIGRFWTLRDVTSDREIEELKIQYGGVRGADELKSKFLTVVSHQLRTPLNAVRWNMEQLLSNDFPQIKGEPKEMLSDVYKAIVTSISIVDDMLLAMAIEQRTLRLDRAEADIGDILMQSVHAHARSAELKGVTLTMQPVPKDLPRLFIDAERIGKAISRLLDNAIVYTRRGGTVTAEVRADKSRVHVIITDTGVGIAQHDQPHIYERFFRSAKAMELNPNASGLGLYITKCIVDTHDGEISFASKDGHGTAFTVSLPRKALAN